MTVATLRIFFLSTLIIFAYCVFETKTHPPTKSASYQEVKNILDKCSKTQLDQKCMHAEFRKLVKTQNLKSAINSLEEIYSKKSDKMLYGYSTCHPFAHMLGKASVENGIPFEKIISSCSEKCGFGCVHGSFSGLGSIEVTKEKCKETLDETLKNECFHGLGHFVSEYYESEMTNQKKAVDFCLDSENDEDVWQCISGLEMGTYSLFMDRYKKTVDIYDIFLKFCNIFPNNFQGDCLSNMGSAAYVGGVDTEEIVKLCNISHDTTTNTECATKFGGALALAKYSNPDYVHTMCGDFGEDTMIRSCLFGAINIYLTGGEPGINTPGKILCDLQNETNKKDCLNYLTGNIKFSGRI